MPADRSIVRKPLCGHQVRVRRRPRFRRPPSVSRSRSRRYNRRRASAPGQLEHDPIDDGDGRRQRCRGRAPGHRHRSDKPPHRTHRASRATTTNVAAYQGYSPNSSPPLCATTGGPTGRVRPDALRRSRSYGGKSHARRPGARHRAGGHARRRARRRLVLRGHVDVGHGAPTPSHTTTADQSCWAVRQWSVSPSR